MIAEDDYAGPFVVFAGVCGGIVPDQYGIAIRNIHQHFTIRSPEGIAYQARFAVIVVGGRESRTCRLVVTMTRPEESPRTMIDETVHFDGTGIGVHREGDIKLESGFEGTIFFEVRIDGDLKARTPLGIVDLYHNPAEPPAPS